MQRERAGGAGLAITLVVVLLVLPILYVLSVGPANWLVNHDRLSPEAAQTIYCPLLLLAQNCDPVGNALLAYCEFCSPSPRFSAPAPPNAAPAPVPAMPNQAVGSQAD